jgi:hypothetical protein
MPLVRNQTKGAAPWLAVFTALKPYRTKPFADRTLTVAGDIVILMVYASGIVVIPVCRESARLRQPRRSVKPPHGGRTI